MDKPRLTLTEIYQLERIRQARLLPQQAGVVFIVSRVVDDVEKFDVRSVALDGSGMRTVARDLENISGMAPSPDGTVWACIAPFHGKPQIAFMNPQTGALRSVTSLPQGVGGPPVWSPCGQWIAFTATGEERAAKGPFDPIRTDSIFYKVDGAGLTQRVLQDIFVVSREWSEVRRLTHGPASHIVTGWSPVEGRLELGFMRALDPDGLESRASVGVIDLQGRVYWVRRHMAQMLYAAGFTGRGDRMMMVAQPPASRFGSPARLYVAPLPDDDGNGMEQEPAAESRTEAFSRDTGGQAVNLVLSTQMTLFSRKPVALLGSDHAVVGCEIAGRSSVRRIALSGPESCVEITAIDSGHCLVDANDSHVLTAHTDYNSPPELYVCDPHGGHRTQLTALNQEFLSSRALPTVRELNFKSKDGAPLQAWMVVPPDASGPVPTYLDIHGGPQSAWGPAWFYPAQALAAIGIATLLANPRGSTGYGEAHVSAIHGSMLQPADDDLLAAVDEAVRQGLADPQHLGVGGVSYGGISTAWMVGKTDRFRCAIPEQMICNLISFYGESDIGRGFIYTQFGVRLTDGFDRLWRNSPLAHAHKAKTPTLIIQNENDHRCPMGEAEQFFVALKEAGCTVELLRIPGASHAAPQIAGITKMSRPRDEAVIDWLTRHLKD